MRNGYCEVPPSDYGNHAIAAEVSEEFLDFTAKQGNDLRIIPGMKGGCKWCLCASRWREAFDARKNDQDPMVPKYVPHTAVAIHRQTSTNNPQNLSTGNT